MPRQSKDELLSLSTLYDKYSPILAKKAAQPSFFTQIKAAISKVLSKNYEKLQTNIIGKRVAFTTKDEEDFFTAMGIDRDEMEKDVKAAPYIAKFDMAGQLMILSQLTFAVPMIILSAEYTKLNKIEAAKLVYMIIFLKPYASRESLFFGKYDVNEDQMLYTVENLTEKSDIKKLGSIINVLNKKAENSYLNYFENFKKTDVLTDAKIYEIYNSGIRTRINNFLNDIAEKYKRNKGKYLNFEANSVAFEDDDGTDIVDSDIKSDTAMKVNIINRASIALNKNPIDTNLIAAACMYSLGSSDFYKNLLTTTINDVVEHMGKRMPEFFTAMISSFLFTINKNTGKRYTMQDFKTPRFLAVMAKKVYADPNTHDINILLVRKMLDEMLENYCDEYLSAMNTKRRNIKSALFMYWTIFLQKAGRG